LLLRPGSASILQKAGKVERSQALSGREAELAVISGFLDSVPAGPSSLLLRGEPGIGKTTLLRAGREDARHRSIAVLASEPAESERRLSFSGLGDLLGGVLHATLPELPPAQGRALRAALLVDDESLSNPPDPRAIGLAVLGVLRVLAARAPVLVAVDDAQWLDQPSTSALAFGLRRLTDEPIGLLACVRVEEAPRGPTELEDALHEENVHRISIGPLSLGALHRLISQRLGRALTRPALARIHKVSGGNPFFAQEIARALIAQGGRVDPGQPLPVPEDLRDLLGARLGALPLEAREVLPAVAALLEPTVAHLDRVIPPDRVESGLEASIDAGVLVAEEDRLRFTHPLLASTVYSRLLPKPRRDLHRRLARVSDDPEEHARHLALGSEGPDAEVASALERAAAQAGSRGAPDVAAELAEHSSRLTPIDAIRERRGRMTQAVRYRIAAGELDRAWTMGQKLLEERLSPTERADVLVLVAEYAPGEMQEGLDLLDQAARLAAADRRRLITIHRIMAGNRLVHGGDLPGALVEARRVLDLAEREGNPRLQVLALALVGSLESYVGSVTPGLLERGVRLEGELGGPAAADHFDSPRSVEGMRLMYNDRLEEARARLEEAYARAAAAGDEVARQGTLIFLTELECRAGNWERARRHASEGLESAEQSGNPQEGAYLYAKALVEAHLGHVEVARAAAQRGVAASEQLGDEIFRAQNTAVLGFLNLSMGNPAEADRLLRPLADWLDAHGWGEPSVYPVLPNAIEALVALSELGEARRLHRRLESRGRAAGSAWARATGGRCRGMILAAEGDLPGAMAALEEALEVHRLIPGPFERARTLLALGTCQRRAKQKAVARRSLQEARDVFRGLGASLWTERAEAELGRIGGRSPSPLEMTPTEWQVASLVAEGLSNREVAARLFVSVRTVEANLTRIYAKLGVRSRTELAHRLASAEP
jgi:DNA-binding CsgD family transcriptional regulator